MSDRKHILLVQGTWGGLSRETADQYMEVCLVRPLQEQKRQDPRSGELEPANEVMICDKETTAELDGVIQEFQPELVIFNSRSHCELAHAFKKNHPNIIVVVVTGLVPKDEIIVLDKRMVTRDLLKNLMNC